MASDGFFPLFAADYVGVNSILIHVDGIKLIFGSTDFFVLTRRLVF